MERDGERQGPGERLFLALNPDVETLKRLDSFQSRLRRELADFPGLDGGLRWPAVAQLHLTLVFVGTLPRALIPVIAERTRAAAARLPPIAIRFTALSVFPEVRPPRVVWLDCERAPALSAAQRAMTDALATALPALKCDDSLPHVTLARLPRNAATRGDSRRRTAARTAARRILGCPRGPASRALDSHRGRADDQRHDLSRRALRTGRVTAAGWLKSPPRRHSPCPERPTPAPPAPGWNSGSRPAKTLPNALARKYARHSGCASRRRKSTT